MSEPFSSVGNTSSIRGTQDNKSLHKRRTVKNVKKKQQARNSTGYKIKKMGVAPWPSLIEFYLSATQYSSTSGKLTTPLFCDRKPILFHKCGIPLCYYP